MKKQKSSRSTAAKSRPNARSQSRPFRSRFASRVWVVAFLSVAILGVVSLGISHADSTSIAADSGSDPENLDTVGLGSPGAGSSVTTFKLCLHFDHSYCINGAGVGNAVYLVHNGGESFHVYVPLKGSKVTSTWPFNIGLGLNDKYEGDPVYIFCVANETSHCLENNTSSQLVYTAHLTSEPGSSAWFVWDNTGSGAFLTNVGETNYRNNGNSYGMAVYDNNYNIYDYYIHLDHYFTRWWYVKS